MCCGVPALFCSLKIIHTRISSIKVTALLYMDCIIWVLRSVVLHQDKIYYSRWLVRLGWRGEFLNNKVSFIWMNNNTHKLSSKSSIFMNLDIRPQYSAHKCLKSRFNHSSFLAQAKSVPTSASESVCQYSGSGLATKCKHSNTVQCLANYSGSSTPSALHNL